MRTPKITFLFVILSSLTNMVLGQQHHIVHYSPSSEFENPRFTNLYQKKNGLIWAGSKNGLFRFDGTSFKHYPHSDTSRFEEVTALGEDNKGTLWIGYANGNLAYLENNLVVQFHPEEGTPVKPITGLIQKGNDEFWFSTYGEGLYVYTNNRLYNIDEEDGLASNDIYNLITDKEGRIWAGTDRGISICSFRGGKKQIKNIGLRDGLPDIIVEDMFVSENGDVWLAFYDKGICVIKNNSNDIELLPQLQNWSFGVAKSISILENKSVWIGTHSNGILKIDLTDQTRVEKVASSNQQKIDSAIDLLKDEEGNIWFIDIQGNIKMFNPTFEYFDHKKFNFIDNIQSVFCDQGGSIWFSSSYGLFEYQPQAAPDSKFKQHLSPLTEKPTGINIISLNEDAEGKIWIGSFGNGVYVYDPETGDYQRFSEKDQIVNDNVLSISKNSNDLWLGTLGGITHAQPKNTHWNFINYDPHGKLGSSYIYDVHICSKGQVWLATDGDGLKVLDSTGKFTTFSESEGRSFKTIYSIEEDTSGNIWFSSPTTGLFKFNRSTFQNFTQEHGLRNIEISGLKLDDQNRLLIIHKSGLDVLDIETDHINYLGSESGIGIIDGNLNAVARAPNGDIWIGGKESLIRYQTFDEKPHMDPQIEINQVQVFLEPVNPREYKFNHNQNHLSFNYIGIWYTNPEIVKYRHKLEGYDIDWVVSRDRFASYPHLGHGDYKFLVQATADQSFKFTKTAEVNFSIAPPFWKTWWFIILGSITALSLFYYWIKSREARVKSEERAKKEMVEFQLQTLKSQVNPHFLFNSFNTLITIIEEDQDLAVEYVEKLSDFFRSIIQYRETELISLKEEIDLLKTYFYLLKQRYENNLALVINFSLNGNSYSLPPLTLQLLVENAVKHNIISKKHPLKIEINMARNTGEISVTNNLQRKKKAPVSTHFGLENIDTRFKLLHGKGITINESENAYTVTLPLIKDKP